MRLFLCLLFTTVFANIFLSQTSSLSISIPSVVCAGGKIDIAAINGTNGAVYCTWTCSPSGAQFSATASPSVTASFNTPGAYTIYAVSSTSAGIATGSIAITVVAPISIQLSQSAFTTCVTNNAPMFSKPVVLTANGASTYVWFPYNSFNPPGSSVTVRPQSTTVYTVVGTTFNGCNNQATVSIIVIPQFTISTSATNPSLCVGDSLKLSVANVGAFAVGPTSAFSYSWTSAPPFQMTGGNGSSISPTVMIYPTTAQTYTVELYDSRQCISIPVHVNAFMLPCIAGIGKNTTTKGLAIYPNPVKDNLNIENLNYALIRIEMYNGIGQKVFSRNLSQGNNSERIGISLSTFENGLYIVKAIYDTGQEDFYKVIKQ